MLAMVLYPYFRADRQGLAHVHAVWAREIMSAAAERQCRINRDTMQKNHGYQSFIVKILAR
jgi:hypothetical protein